MSEEGVSSMRESVNFIERQPSVLARWSRGSRFTWVLLAVYFVCLHGRVEQAHAEPGRFEVGAKLAPSLEQHLGERVNSEAVHAYKPGFTIGAGLRYALLRDGLSVQTELLYATRGSNVDLDGRTALSLHFTYLEVPVLGRARFPLGGAIRPTLSGYAILGPTVSFLLGAEIDDAGGRRALDRDGLNALDVGVVAGLGVTWEVTPAWALSLEARYDQGFINAIEGADRKNQAFLLTLGVDFTLRHGDRDGDLVADYRDRCLTEAEDKNGYKDDDGCPDAHLDSDGDGVFAENDQCPDEKEDKNGYQDDDGCPDAHRIDTDEDGIFDVADACDDKAFGFNKDVDLGKLPEALKGQVPGCPPELAHVRVERDQARKRDWLVLDEPLLFDYTEQEIHARHEATLNEVALLLAWYYPNMRLQVVGHTDSKSGQQTVIRARENVRESLKRADNVRAYLMSKGIDPERLESVGRGDKDPIDQKHGENPRNRRVELIIIEMGPATSESVEENAIQ